MFMFIMLHSNTDHNEYCTEHFPNGFCVVTVNKNFLLSNGLRAHKDSKENSLQTL